MPDYTHLNEALKHVVGYIYPNDIEAHWSILIVLYPVSLDWWRVPLFWLRFERVFNVREVRPTYRLHC